MKQLFITLAGFLFTLMVGAGAATADIVSDNEENQNYASMIEYDPYLDVEIWTDDDDYNEGDNIQISFKADKDCFIAIYNINSRGEANLIFPTDPWESNRIEGHRIYTIPDRYGDYDLTVQGPPGEEFLRMVASRDPIDIPDWFDGSDLATDDDPYDFMEYIDAMFFRAEGRAKRSFDMTSFVVEEWHDYYFRPVYDYHHHRHHYDPFWDWSLYGGVYVDYPFGATIYIDGVYWGIAPLYVPRIYYGWHYVTVYDHRGHCWEDRVNVVKRKEIVLNDRVIKTRLGAKSRFKDVRKKAYLDPAKNGYPKYKKQVVSKKKYRPVSKTATVDKTTNVIIKKTNVTKNKTVYKDNSKRSNKSSTKIIKNASKSNAEKRNTAKTEYKSGKSSTKSTNKYKSSKYKSSKSTKTSKSSDKYKSSKSTKSSKSSDKYKSSKSTKSSKSSDKYKSSKSTKSSKSSSKYKSSKSTKSSKSGSKASKKSSKSSSKSSSGSSKKSSASSKKSDSNKSSSFSGSQKGSSSKATSNSTSSSGGSKRRK